MKEIKITRRSAAALLDAVRELLARRTSPEQIELVLQEQYQIDPLTSCNGEAHLPEVAGNIDNCMVCAPRWGWAGPRIKIT